MKLSVKTVAILVLLLVAARPGTAGTLLLSGDSNIGNPIDGSVGAPVDPGNASFFGNILDSGTSVLIQNGLTFDVSAVDSANAINTYYNGLAGVTSTLDISEAPITGGLLAGADLYIGMLPSDGYAASEIAAIGDFLSASGTVLFMGDAEAATADQNARINAALSDLGSLMFLGSSSLDPGFQTTTNIDADPFTAGIATFSYAFTNNIVAGGTSLIRSLDPNNATFIAYESSAVPEPASLTVFGLMAGMAGMGIRRRKSNRMA